MTERPNGLRAARAAHGWSQMQAAREIADLANDRGVPVAAAASLKSLLSRWENGHATPEPQYRALLGRLFDRTPAELGIEGAGAGPTDFDTAGRGAGSARLRAAIAAAASVDGRVVELWREQLAVARRLDDELGGAGAAGLVRAQVEQLDRTLAYTVTPTARRPVAAVLAAAAALAGAQALDHADHDDAWRHYGRSGSAASEAGLPVAAVAALAGQATVLVEAGEPGSALALLGVRCPPGPPAVQIRWEAARGLASAGVGAAEDAHSAFAAAARAFDAASRDFDPALQAIDPAAAVSRNVHVDVFTTSEPAIELVDLHRWHGHALAALGDDGAIAPLERALAAGPRSVRHRAGLHADLADALLPAQPAEAAAHARAARELATRIGSECINARLTRRPGTP